MTIYRSTNPITIVMIDGILGSKKTVELVDEWDQDYKGLIWKAENNEIYFQGTRLIDDEEFLFDIYNKKGKPTGDWKMIKF